MGDLLVFVAIVGLMIAVGIAVGMIVASRLDRIMAPPPRTPHTGDAAQPDPVSPGPAAEPQEPQP